MLTLLLFLLHRTIKTRTCELQPHKSNFPLRKPADNVHSMSVFFYHGLQSIPGALPWCPHVPPTLQYAVCVSSLPLNINILLKNISLVGRRNKRQGNSAAAQHLEAPPTQPELFFCCLCNKDFCFFEVETQCSWNLGVTLLS